MFLSLSRKSKSNRRKLASNESHVRASHAARKTAIRKAYRFCKRETLHQTSASFHVRRLINARFHPACRSPLFPHPTPRAREETLSRLGSVVRYRDPKRRSIDGYRELFWCIVQPRSMAFLGNLINEKHRVSLSLFPSLSLSFHFSIITDRHRVTVSRPSNAKRVRSSSNEKKILAKVSGSITFRKKVSPSTSPSLNGVSMECVINEHFARPPS